MVNEQQQKTMRHDTQISHLLLEMIGLTQDFVQQKDNIMKTEIPTSTDAFGEKATHTHKKDPPKSFIMKRRKFGILGVYYMN
jgi:hypothetical protein